MTYPIQTFRLSSGAEIPWLAWGNGSGTARKTALESGNVALESGICHIDTAQGYKNEGKMGENERIAGDCLKAAGKGKEGVFVTTKLSEPGPDDAAPHECDTVPTDQIRNEILASIERLGFTPDLLLIHNPFVVKDLKAAWKVLEDMKDAGELQDIGVSNFRPQDFEAILPGAKHIPAAHQLEYHPYVLSHIHTVLDICAKHNILIQSYGPLTPILRHPTGGPLKPVLKRIAERITKDNPDLPVKIDEVVVLLLWTRAQSVVAVSASGNKERIKTLADISRLPDGLITTEEIDEIVRAGKGIYFRHYTEHMEYGFPPPQLPDGK
ncbi:NADP-dependent oxidoreductase domain-containing protein [Flagelloscypha sp. PMI_526]|nr:NADP-dependent oxidoreductase domain-containing protein [Flagelloscypha sp. PMI_526]